MQAEPTGEAKLMHKELNSPENIDAERRAERN